MLQTSAIFWLSSTQIPSLLSWNNPLYELSEPFHLWTLRDLTLSSYSLLVRIYTNDIWMLIIFSSSLKQMMGEWRPLRNFSQWWWGSQGQDIVDLIPAALWANLVAVAWTKSHSIATLFQWWNIASSYSAPSAIVALVTVYYESKDLKCSSCTTLSHFYKQFFSLSFTFLIYE